MQFSKLLKLNLSFLKKKESKKIKPQFLPKPGGVILIGKHKLYKASKENLETYPIYAFLIAEETFLSLKGYAIYSTIGFDNLFIKGVDFVRPAFVQPKFFEISDEDKMQENVLPSLGEIEEKVAGKVIEVWLKRLQDFKFTCENEMAKYTNDLGRWWLKLKLFKELGGLEMLYKAKDKALERGKDFDLKGAYSIIVDRLRDINVF
jgi:hypothetical protein